MKKLVVIVMVFALVFATMACTAEPATQTSAQASPSASGASASPSTEKYDASNVTGWKDTFTIGMYNCLTGKGAAVGAYSQNGLLLAVAQKNAQGGILGAEIKTIIYDDGGNPEESVKCVTRLINQDKVDAMVAACTSGCILSAGSVFDSAGVITMGPGNSASLTDQGWTYLFRCCLSNDYTSVSVLNAAQKMGIKTMYMFVVSLENGVTSAKSMETAVAAKAQEGYAVEILGTEYYESGDVDFSGQISKIIAANPDAVYVVANTAELGPFAKQLRANGYSKPILGTDNWVSTDALEVAGSAANDVIFTAPAVVYSSIEDIDPNYEQMITCCKGYQEMFGEMPKSSQVYRSYDGAMLLFEAIERAKSFKSQDIRDMMYTINDYAGLQGVGNTNGCYDFTVTKDGEGLLQAASWAIKDGKYISLDNYLK